MPRPALPPRLEFIKRPQNKTALWYIVYTERGRQRFHSTGTGDSGQAEKEFAAWLACRINKPVGKALRPDQVPIADALAWWGASGVSKESARWAGFMIAALLPFWGTMRVSEINKDTCQDYYKRRVRALSAKFPGRVDPEHKSEIDEELTAAFDGTLRAELAALSWALDYARKENCLSWRPYVWTPGRPAARTRWLTRQEAGQLLRAARRFPVARKHLPLFILIGLYTGQRHRAISTLQWIPSTTGGHVDLERGVIDFNPVGRRRTSKARPIVRIPRRLMPFLIAAKKWTRRYVIEYQGQTATNVTVSFKAALKAAGIEGVTPHTMRHTAITWRMQRGVDIREVADFTGVSEAVIRKVYYHAHPDYQKAAADAY